MKISETTKKRILEVDVEDVASSLGIEVKHHKCLCFMHDDHAPSIKFYSSSNTWFCFVCNKGGDPISLVQEKLGLGFPDACRWIASQFNIPLEDGEDADFSSNIRERKVERRVEPEIKPDCEMMAYMLDHLRLGAKAREFLYLERRLDAQVVRSLNIKSIPERNALADELVSVFGRERALESRLVFSYGDRYRLYFNSPCLIFPYYDAEGNLVNLQARYIGDRKGCPRFQFTMGSKPHAFNLPVLKKKGVIFISEGVTDCLAMLSSGKNAIAVPSASLLKDEDVKLLATHKVRMYPDNDEAGERLFHELEEKIAKKGGEVTRMKLQDCYKDYAEFYKKRGYIWKKRQNEGKETH